MARRYLQAVGLYYCVITPLHLIYKDGTSRTVLFALAAFSAISCLALARRLRRPARLGILELGTLFGNALLLGNVVVDQLLDFEDHQLLYFMLMPLAFATVAPSRRVVYASVAAALGAMIAFAPQAQPNLAENAVFLALATGSVSIAMSNFMRGALMRELGARLAAEDLNHRLETELALNTELRRESEALAFSEQAANRTKSEFLATVSHELRTPLNGVLGMAQIMALGDLSAEQRGQLDTIQVSGQTLLRTINDVLDISKIEAGRLELISAPFDLGAMADGLANLYVGLADDKGLAFSFEIGPEARGWRHGDEVRLRQVISNLLSNALKFTESGSVALRIAATDDQVVVLVQDSGIGIGPDARAGLFEKFVQADASITRRFGGTGLGLAICREILDRMGGEIGIESQAGQGSCFRVSLPLPVSEAPASHIAPQVSGASDDASLQLLVADDNPINRAVVEALLAPLGIEVTQVASGREAVEAWTAQSWDAVLMDIHMPGMDGMEATTHIRRLEAKAGRARTPIIALTASVMPHERQGYLAAGMDDCVAKPIDLANLLSSLQQCVGTQEAEEAPALVRA